MALGSVNVEQNQWRITMANDLTVKDNQAVSTDILNDFQAFENAQRIGKMLTQSQIVPSAYQNNLPNTIVALEIAARTRLSPIVVMQNLNIIKGTPRWSSRYLIAAMTTSRVTNLHYELISDGRVKVPGFKNEETIDNLKCRAIATDRRSGKEYVGPWVTMEMAVKEGWYGKDGSKWKTMPEMMIRYRAATFFANVYYPDLSVGMAIEDDSVDTSSIPMPTAEVVQSGEIITPPEEAPVKAKRTKKTVAKEETPVSTPAPAEPEQENITDASFEEVADDDKPAPVAAPQADDSDEWSNWEE